jgi:hypothetical protein
MNSMKKRMCNGSTHTREDADTRSSAYAIELLHRKESSHGAFTLCPESILTANPATHQFLYTNLTTSSLFGRDGDELTGYAYNNVGDSPAFFFDDETAKRIIDRGLTAREREYMKKHGAAGSGAAGHCSTIAPVKYWAANPA